MIYEDERTVDEPVDDILSPDEPVRETETPSVGGAQMEKSKKPRRVYLNRCRDCRQTFETPYVGGKYCPACKRRRISEGQKARQAREHAANDRQVKNGDIGKTKEAGTMENSEKTVAEAWKTLAAEETDASKDPAAERGTESRSREAREVLVDLYGTVRRIAQAAGLDPSRTIEALWEIDSILGNVARV